MQVRLIERGEKLEDSREVPIRQPEFLIGRGPDCDLRLPIASVSRHHCLVHLENDAVSLTDLGSANGTFVNGQRVRSQATLQSGDLIMIGTAQFVVDLGDQGSGVLSGGTKLASTTVKIPFEVPGTEKKDHPKAT